MSGEFGYIVWREGVDNRIPYRVGDAVTTYELAEPWRHAEQKPHEGHSSELAAYEEAVLSMPARDSDWRVEKELTCTCPSRRVIAQLLVHTPTARRWATAKPEQVPSAFRKGPRVVHGWPLHGQPNEVPHVGSVASCKGCRKRWLVTSTVDDVLVIGIKSAHHGARVAP